jgi:hypothetical protein
VAAAAEEEAGEREAQHDGLDDVHDAERDGVDHGGRGAAAQGEGGETREPALPPEGARERRREPGRAGGGWDGQPPAPAAPGQVVVPGDELPQPPARARRTRRRHRIGRGYGRRLRNRARPRRRRVRLDGHWPPLRCRCPGAGEGVRALVWLETLRSGGGLVVGKTGERDREDVGVVGDATCSAAGTGADDEKTRRYMGEATGEGGSGTLAPVSFCFVPARSSALLCAQARQQRCNGERASERASSLAPATQRLEIKHSFPAQHSFQLASFWLTKGEFHRSQFMRFLCYATQEGRGVQGTGIDRGEARIQRQRR